MATGAGEMDESGEAAPVHEVLALSLQPVPMTWDYVAGFFDGEGSAGIYVGSKRGNEQGRIVFSNTELACLQEIQEFLQAGQIYGGRGGNRPCYSLVVYRVDDLRRIVPELLTRCRIKGPALTKVLAQTEGRASVPTHGALAKLGVETVRRLYWEEGLSLAQIAQRVGVRTTSVGNFMTHHGIPRRPPGPLVASLAALGEDALRRMYCDEGLTMKQIGERVGVDWRTVQSALHRHDIPTRSQGPRMDADEWKSHYGRLSKSPQAEERIRAMYWNEGLSIREIAAVFGVAPKNVRFFMEQHDIPRRPPGRPRSAGAE